MLKSTPGPWVFGTKEWLESDTYEQVIVEQPFDYRGKGYNWNPGIFGPNGEPIVDCGGEYYLFSGPADARLLTAAPDLLDMLKAALADWDQAPVADCVTGDWAEGARALIERIEGEQA